MIDQSQDQRREEREDQSYVLNEGFRPNQSEYLWQKTNKQPELRSKTVIHVDLVSMQNDYLLLFSFIPKVFGLMLAINFNFNSVLIKESERLNWSNGLSLNEAWNKKVSVCWMRCEDAFALSLSLIWRVRWNWMVEAIEMRSRKEAFAFNVWSQIAEFSRCQSNQKAFEESMGLM